jgi:murein L,D-transpeptidase YcbB/YkuD
MPGFALALDNPQQDIAERIAAAIHPQQQNVSTTMRAGAGSAADNLAWFYAQRDFAPAWSDLARLSQLVSALEDLVDDGLDPGDYHLQQLQTTSRAESVTHEERDPMADSRACADLLATDAYLRALNDLSFGRLDPADVEPLWRFRSTDDVIADRERLMMLAQSGLDDIEATFERARPSLPRYHGLRQAHGELRARLTNEVWPQVPSGRSLREGMTDPRVPLLRARLLGTASGDTWVRNGATDDTYDAGGLLGSNGSNGDTYDADLVAAVRAFQRSHQLEVYGIVVPSTLSALNVPLAARLDQLRVNLERMRWLAREHDSTFVLVDVAGARVSYYRNGEVAWEARTQVGRPARPTPLLKSEITHFTFNPTWTIPPTILRNDKLPEIRRDITYLAQNNIRVLDHSGNELAPDSIDWERPGAIMLRQDAGADNALGQVAIRFPNPFHVYLHDTPSQRHFSRDQRALSSGCVRVERAMELVGHLLDDGTAGDHDRAAAIIASGKTRNFNLARPVPVLLAYWTADITTDGSLIFRPDVYDHDKIIHAALQQTRAHDRIMPACAQTTH